MNDLMSHERKQRLAHMALWYAVLRDYERSERCRSLLMQLKVKEAENELD